MKTHQPTRAPATTTAWGIPGSLPWAHIALLGTLFCGGCMAAPATTADTDQASPVQGKGDDAGTQVGLLQTRPARWPGSWPQWIEDQWVSIMNIQIPDELVERIERNQGHVVNYAAGGGYVVTDAVSVEVCLPEACGERRYDQLLQTMLNDPNGFGGTQADDFDDEVSFPKDTDGRVEGDVVLLDIWGPDNGAIAYIDVDASDHQVCVVTVDHPDAGSHPVAGIRCWGMLELVNGCARVYTTGVDSSTWSGSGWVGGPLQRETWTALMESVATTAILRGGSAGTIWYDTEIQQAYRSPGENSASNVDGPAEIDGSYSATDATLFNTCVRDEVYDGCLIERCGTTSEYHVDCTTAIQSECADRAAARAASCRAAGASSC